MSEQDTAYLMKRQDQIERTVIILRRDYGYEVSTKDLVEMVSNLMLALPRFKIHTYSENAIRQVIKNGINFVDGYAVINCKINEKRYSGIVNDDFTEAYPVSTNIAKIELFSEGNFVVTVGSKNVQTGTTDFYTYHYKIAEGKLEMVNRLNCILFERTDKNTIVPLDNNKWEYDVMTGKTLNEEERKFGPSDEVSE